MFNIQGGELIFLLLIALVVLGPDKLPEAVRKFGKTYGELKKMANGFQGELRQVLDEPMRELRDTADAVREAANFDAGDPEVRTVEDQPGAASPASPGPRAAPPVRREQALDFGLANPRRRAREEGAADEGPAE